MSTDTLTARSCPAPLDTPQTMDELWHVMNMLGNGEYRTARTQMSMTDEQGFNRLLELERGIMTNFHQPYDGATALPSEVATQVQDLMNQLGCLRQNTIAQTVGSRLNQGMNWVRTHIGWRTNGELA